MSEGLSDEKGIYANSSLASGINEPFLLVALPLVTIIENPPSTRGCPL